MHISAENPRDGATTVNAGPHAMELCFRTPGLADIFHGEDERHILPVEQARTLTVLIVLYLTPGRFSGGKKRHFLFFGSRRTTIGL